MSNGLDSDNFMKFFTTVMIDSKFIERDPDDFAKCWHPDLIQCMEIAQEKGKVGELRNALEHKFAALNLSEEGKHTEAINQYRKAVDVFPYSLHFKFILALGYIATKETDVASKLLEDILLAKPNDWEAKYYLSRCCYMLDDVDRAIDLLEYCIHANYEPDMSLEMGIYCASKGERIGKELYRKLGVYDQQKTAEVASPFLEKAINNFQQYSKTGKEVDPQYFDRICNLLDQLSPGKLQYMGVSLSLNRLHRVLSNVDEIPAPVLDAKFDSEKNVCSALVASCDCHGKGSDRYQATVLLFETNDSDKITNKTAKPFAEVRIISHGLNQEIPDVNLSYIEEETRRPEAILQAGAELCQNGNLTGGIAKFREALKCNPRPGTRMILNHNLALALSVEADVVWGPGGRVPVNNDNVAFLDEALERWGEVCKIYQKEVEGTSEEEEFSCEPSLKEYMKIASNNGFAISVKLDQFRGKGAFKSAEPEKKSGCFIATACYGSYAAPEVLVLRQFRDEVLLESKAGRVFVRFYYTVSPPIARFIQKREKLKGWVRCFLISRIVRKIRSRT